LCTDDLVISTDAWSLVPTFPRTAQQSTETQARNQATSRWVVQLIDKAIHLDLQAGTVLKLMAAFVIAVYA